MACLKLGPLADRRFLASRFAKRLIEWGDSAMYRAKADPHANTQVVELHIERGELVENAAAPDGDAAEPGAGAALG